MLPGDDQMVGPSISPQGNKRLTDTASKSPPAKRAKLNDEERAAKELEREQRRRKQEEKRQEIEEKKRIKDEERRLKDEERRVREEEKRVRNEERKLKEEERLRKEDEKRTKKEAEDELKRLAAAAIEKKERSQLRMGNFFQKVDPKPVAVLQTTQTTLFKPFYVKENARLANICVKSKTSAQDFEQLLANYASSCSITFHKGQLRRKSRRRKYASLKSRLQEVTSVPLEERLRDVNYRLLQFSSDIRPAYFGTMTADPEVPGLRTGRNPFHRAPRLNYDYDSELDWIEGDDEDVGEDLASDDEASVISKDTYGEDDDDFLDDEEVVDSVNQRRQGHLIPLIQGMFHSENDKAVQHMTLQKLIEVSGPIDPFFDYWDDRPKTAKVLTDMKTVNNQLIPQPIPKLLKKASTHGEANVTFPENLLPDFKQAINGSTLKKAILVEKLRIDFASHKLTKKVIESKLNEIAIRKGRGQNDSWTLI